MPSNRDIILFMLGNDARFRSNGRNSLTKKILKTLKKESPHRYWAYHGTIYGLLVIALVIAYFMVQDAYGDVMPYAYTLLGLMVAAIPALGYAGFKMYETYFSKYPEDFPND